MLDIKGFLRVFSLDSPLLGVPELPVLCSNILTLDSPLLEAKVALICTCSAQVTLSGHSLTSPPSLPSYLIQHHFHFPLSVAMAQLCFLLLWEIK
ncbi:hypothetical protein L208DRAFT_1267117 [Tricholoma matsutake]|nr:hypothetical protein L208DRAFT_1267117 [Tricholoma matsutake 945]